MRPLISIVITSLSAPCPLDLTLQALDQQTYDKSAFECLIVGDRSLGDAAIESLVRGHPGLNIVFIRADPRIGQSVSRNIGWQHAIGELIVFLDGGTVPVSSWLETHMRFFGSSRPSAISGASYYLSDTIKDSALAMFPSVPAGADGPAGGNAAEASRYQYLASHSCPGRCSTLWYQEMEQSLYSFANEHSQSPSLHGYCINGANLLITRQMLEETKGFAPLLARGEDFDLGIRIVELGGELLMRDDARTYHPSSSAPMNRPWSDRERDAFIYKHPSKAAAIVCLRESLTIEKRLHGWTSSRSDAGVGGPAKATISYLTWSQLLTQLPPGLIAGSFDYTLDDIRSYFSEIGAMDEAAADIFVSQGITAGMLTRESRKASYFDLYHTGNWLRARTLYQDHCLKYAAFARTHLTPRQKQRWCHGTLIHCKGRYVMDLGSIPKEHGRSAAVNVSIPIEHDNQYGVKLTRLVPAKMELYLDDAKGLFVNIPSSVAAACRNKLMYEFECDIAEGCTLPSSKSTIARPPSSNGVEADPLRFSFPTRYLPKASALLDHILDGTRSRPEVDLRKVYRWIVTRLSYANTPLPDYSILDTGIGTCIQLSRLFANLVRLMNVPAREQCGALMCRGVSTSLVASVTREYSPFTHTWIEVYLEEKGWLPIEFIVMRYTESEVTPFNVGRELRAEMLDQTEPLVEYYCGNVDPYRVYTGHYANKVPPVVFEGLGARKYLLSNVQHHLTCSITPCE